MSKIGAAPTIPRAPRGAPRTLLNGGWLAKRAKQGSEPKPALQAQGARFFPHTLQELGARADPGYGVERIATWQPRGMISKNSRMSVSRIRMHPWEAIRPMLSSSGVP